MPGENGSRKGFLLAGFIAALASFAPFFRIFLGGQSLYFRDLSGQFFPARRFFLEGLAHGELRFWNPLVHEGEPMALSPFGYLPDLLQLLIPSEFGISLFLALHIPFAAISFTLLARELNLTPVAAAAGAIIYALGGFSLSTVNLYVYVQTMAWAPLFILAFRRALEEGRPRAVAVAAIGLAMTISTTGLEIAIQACFLAVVIAPPSNGRRFLRAIACAILGLGLAAVIVMPLLGVMGNSTRGSGFTTAAMLVYSIHPLTLLQVFIAGFYGDTSNLTGIWWGENFFPQGFPYILSLYLGPAVLALAGAGVAVDRPLRRRLALVAVAAAVVGLGRYAGWEAFFDLSPTLRFLRYPVKAFFTVQFSIALLASFAVQAVATGTALYLARLASVCIGLGGALVGTLLIPTLAPRQTGWLLEGFLPSDISSPVQRDLIARFVAGDAATSGIVVIVVGALCLLARGNRLDPSRAAVAIVALLAADLIRAGAGLNPSVTADFYQMSPEMAHQVDLVRQSGGRVFTCDLEASQTYWKARFARGVHHEAFSMATMQETLLPDFNVPFGVRTALSPDRTSLAPSSRVLSLELSGCSKFDLIVPALRTAGVTRVVSLDLLNDPSLRLLSEVSPARIAPLKIRVYELTGALPRFDRPVTIIRDRPDDLSVEVFSERPTQLIVRDPFARGWRATVNGLEGTIQRTVDGHRELSVPKGRSRVHMSYEPEGLRSGLSITLLSSLLCLGLLLVAPRPASKATSSDQRA